MYLPLKDSLAIKVQLPKDSWRNASSLKYNYRMIVCEISLPLSYIKVWEVEVGVGLGIDCKMNGNGRLYFPKTVSLLILPEYPFRLK
jgi:hypothetical protein